MKILQSSVKIMCEKHLFYLLQNFLDDFMPRRGSNYMCRAHLAPATLLRNPHDFLFSRMMLASNPIRIRQDMLGARSPTFCDSTNTLDALWQ
jgi:hypothetical protein